MQTLESYVKREFYELVESQWSDSVVEKFILAAANLDTDVHEDIKNIDTDDLMDYIADFDKSKIDWYVAGIQRTLIYRAKQEIKIILTVMGE